MSERERGGQEDQAAIAPGFETGERRRELLQTRNCEQSQLDSERLGSALGFSQDLRARVGRGRVLEGIVFVTCFSAATAGLAGATMSFTSCVASEAANSESSLAVFGQTAMMWIVLPSTYPSSRKPARNASSCCRCAALVPAGKNPMRGTCPGCCPSVTRGPARTATVPRKARRSIIR